MRLSFKEQGCLDAAVMGLWHCLGADGQGLSTRVAVKQTCCGTVSVLSLLSDCIESRGIDRVMHQLHGCAQHNGMLRCRCCALQ